MEVNVDQIIVLTLNEEPGELSCYTGWTARARFPAVARYISLLHNVQTSSGAHPVSYTMGTGSSFISADVKNGGAITPLLHTSSWRGA
jgi:hypothetical protein